MALDPDIIDRLATIVDEAARTHTPIPMLTAEVPELTLDEAYTVQRTSMARRKARGESVTGMKMGLTSKAKMDQMGVHNPIYGHLTDAMHLSDGATIDRANFCHPRVEPEIAFLLGEDIHGPVDPTTVMNSVRGVCAALEIIDSRFEHFKFTLIDVVADNASSTGFLLGPVVKPAADLDLGNLGMVLSINGEIIETGSSAAILEHPANSLAALVNMLHERGEHLKSGQIVLAGATTKAHFLTPGAAVSLDVDQLGTTRLFVAPSE